MWTLNGGSSLSRCFESIAKAVPSDVICHRYVVDGGSTESTNQVEERFGWTIVRSNRRGIPFQANQALDLVDTAVFGSFEQDIGLSPVWFKVVMPALSSDSDVAVAQGLRAASGSRHLEAIDSYAERRRRVPGVVSSIDDNRHSTQA